MEVRTLQLPDAVTLGPHALPLGLSFPTCLVHPPRMLRGSLVWLETRGLCHVLGGSLPRKGYGC